MENKEKYIIDQISNHRETVDTDDLWANVVGAIPQKEEKRRRGLIWFWSGLLLFSLISLFGYMLIDKPEGTTISKGLQNNEVVLEKSLPPIVSLAKNRDSNNLVNDELEKQIKQNSETQVLKVLPTKKETKENQVLFSKINIQTSAVNELPQQVVNQANEINENLISNDHSIINEKKVIDEINGLHIGTEQHIEAKAIIDRNENLAYLSPIDFNKFGYRRTVVINNAEVIKVDLITEKSLKVNKWSMFINSGASFITRNLTITDTEFTDQRNRRDRIENVIGGWDITGGLSYSLTPSLSITSGLTLGQIHEQSTYNTSYLLDSEGQQITSIIHTQDGSVNSVTENIKSYTNRETNEIRNNRLRYYTIPVSLKYRLIESDNYRLNLNGTFTYSISQRYSGFTSLDGSQMAYDLALDVNNDYNRSGAVGYGFGLDASRRLSTLWDINFGVGAKKMQAISSKINPIEQKYKIYTFTFGVSRKI